jgi:hypothetical protein
MQVFDWYQVLVTEPEVEVQSVPVLIVVHPSGIVCGRKQLDEPVSL